MGAGRGGTRTGRDREGREANAGGGGGGLVGGGQADSRGHRAPSRRSREKGGRDRGKGGGVETTPRPWRRCPSVAPGEGLRRMGRGGDAVGGCRA
eukprot:48687-Pleurochrysis_carterae.AAC.1